MAETKTYSGSCHCGAVRYQVEMDLSGPVVVCNCSICSRTGSMLAFAPASSFTLQSGEDKLTDYQFNKKIIHHLFCSVCGIRSFARGRGPDGSESVAINVRCLEGVDLDALQVHRYDGASA
ncbi:MAG TPA: GFA family protein [Kofleriaceae bacterium]|nr:GFA family protein [Kofleriaceae bacterium]